MRLLPCRIWKEGLETTSIPCLALTGSYSQLLGCMNTPLRLVVLLTFSSTFIHMWKEQWHCHCRLSHARGPCTKKIWGTKQHKTAGKMATSLLNLNLLGALMLEIKTLLPFCSGKYLVIILGMFSAPIIFFKKNSLQVIQPLKSVYLFQSCITCIFGSCVVPSQSLLVPLLRWGSASEPCKMLSACTRQLQKPVQLQVPRKSPERSLIPQGSSIQRLSSPTAVFQLLCVTQVLQEGISWS